MTINQMQLLVVNGGGGDGGIFSSSVPYAKKLINTFY
jgi:hypothetical protein